MDEVVITWTIENWVTVVLMVALAYGLVALGTKLIKGQAASAS